MDSRQQQNGHVTIQKGLTFPPLKKCTTCCFQGQYHCPFCSPGSFKPTKRSRVMLHLENHIRRACFIGEYTIHKCNLECVKQAHYHCLHCIAPQLSKQDLNRHIRFCQERPKKTDSQEDKDEGAELEEATELASNCESDDESQNDGVYIVPDTQDRTDQEGSSSRSVSRFVSRSKTSKMTGSHRRHTQLVQCHRMVQTNMDKPQDCDEFYFMNLVKMYKKLTPHKKTEVRKKIERIIFEAEFQ